MCKCDADTCRQVSAAGTPSKPEHSPVSKGQPAPEPSLRPPGSEPPQRSSGPGGPSTGHTPPPAGADSRGALLRRSVAALTGALMCDVTLEALTTEDGMPVDPAAADVATPRAAAVVAMSRPMHTHNRAEPPAPAGAGAGAGGGGGGGGGGARAGAGDWLRFSGGFPSAFSSGITGVYLAPCVCGYTYAHTRTQGPDASARAGRARAPMYIV